MYANKNSEILHFIAIIICLLPFLCCNCDKKSIILILSYKVVVYNLNKILCFPRHLALQRYPYEKLI